MVDASLDDELSPRAPPLTTGPLHDVALSAGVVVVPATEGPAAEDVLRDADAAMYQAKGRAATATRSSAPSSETVPYDDSRWRTRCGRRCCPTSSPWCSSPWSSCPPADRWARKPSLAYLTRFAVHELKIDRSFVDGMSRVENDAAIVSSVIGLAHTLGLSVVAEGVETAEHMAALRALVCDAVQGYYLGRPAPPDAVLPRLLGMSPTAGPPA